MTKQPKESPILCDWCDEPVVTVSTHGDASTRRARCRFHRGSNVGGEYFALMEQPTRPENAWIRDKANRLDDDVMPEVRRRNKTVTTARSTRAG